MAFKFSSPLWDPANLLQITDNLRDRSGKVNCVGITRYDARCKWTIDEPDLSKIRPLLNQMSQSPPESVTVETLRRLARLCLCTKYHSNQVETFVGHWATVVKAAVQHHKNMGMQVGGGTPSDIDSLRSQLSHKIEEAFHLERDLAAARQAYVLLQDKGESAALELSDQIDRLEKQLRESQNHQRTTEAMLLEIKESHQVLQDRVAEESMARGKAEEETTILRGRVQDADEQLKSYGSIKQENGNLKKEITKLEEENDEASRHFRAEVVKSHAIEQQLAVERVAKESMAHQYQGQLDEQQAQSSALKSRIGNLEIIVAQLEASISACWSHRFWAWVARARKGNKAQQWTGMKGEQVEEIPLKTYA